MANLGREADTLARRPERPLCPSALPKGDVPDRPQVTNSVVRERHLDLILR